MLKINKICILKIHLAHSSLLTQAIKLPLLPTNITLLSHEPVTVNVCHFKYNDSVIYNFDKLHIFHPHMLSQVSVPHVAIPVSELNSLERKP